MLWWIGHSWSWNVKHHWARLLPEFGALQDCQMVWFGSRPCKNWHSELWIAFVAHQSSSAHLQKSFQLTLYAFVLTSKLNRILSVCYRHVNWSNIGITWSCGWWWRYIHVMQSKWEFRNNPDLYFSKRSSYSDTLMHSALCVLCVDWFSLQLHTSDLKMHRTSCLNP